MTCLSSFDEFLGKEVRFFGERVTIYRTITCAISELIGTTLFVFWGCCFLVTGLSHLEVSFGIGLAYASLVGTFRHISLGLLNPCLTVTAVGLSIINVPMGLLYFLCQCIGGILGYLLLMALVPPEIQVNRCCTIPPAAMSVVQSFSVELCLSIAFAFVLCGVSDKRNRHHQDSVALKMGFALTGLIFTGSSLTGASMNPARSLGPAVFENVWRDHWVYWSGPLLGGAMGAIIYRFLLANERMDKSLQDEQ